MLFRRFPSREPSREPYLKMIKQCPFKKVHCFLSQLQIVDSSFSVGDGNKREERRMRFDQQDALHNKRISMSAELRLL